jgi:hypothetical protein
MSAKAQRGEVVRIKVVIIYDNFPVEGMAEARNKECFVSGSKETGVK